MPKINIGEHRKAKHLSKPQVTAFFNTVRSEAINKNNWRDYAIFQICYTCGLRVEEIRQLKRSEIDVSIPDKPKIMVWRCKGSQSAKFILPINVWNTLIKYLNSRKDTKDEMFITSWRNSHNRKKNTSISTPQLRRLFRRYCERADKNVPGGIPSHLRHPHALRHSIANHLYENKAKMFEIQAILGHKNPKSTEIYVSVSEDRMNEIIQNLDLSVLGENDKTTPLVFKPIHKRPIRKAHR